MDVLSRSSLVFKSMVELCETDREIPEERTVYFSFSGSCLTQLVQYCNTQNVTVANMEILIGMVDYFLLNDAVTDTCLELMAKNLCVENIMNFVIASEKRGRNDLILVSLEFIDLFFDSMRSHDKFNEISVGTLQNILKRDTLEVSNEEFVFDVIIKWYAHDKRNRKQFLPDLLKLVRLSDVDRTVGRSILKNRPSRRKRFCFFSSLPQFSWILLQQMNVFRCWPQQLHFFLKMTIPFTRN